VGTGPWMVRIIDPMDALADIPVKGDGSVTFALTDQYCSWNNGTYRLTGRDGRLRLEVTDDSTDIRVNIEGLTALLYGILPTDELRLRGWLEMPDEAVMNLLDHWFPVRPIFSTFIF